MTTDAQAIAASLRRWAAALERRSNVFSLDRVGARYLRTAADAIEAGRR